MLRCASLPNVLRHRPREQALSARLFSVSWRSRGSHEAVTVPCASNGTIELDIYHPLRASASGRVAIYLPRGPIISDSEQDASNIAVIRSATPFPIVKINYRYGKQHHYPTPVHDVLAGYDWIIGNLLPKRGITRAGRSEHVGKLAVCGELVGGQLATALALTECRVGEPGVVAAAVNNPIVDWVELSSALKTSEVLGVTAVSIVDQMKPLFRKPEHYYDPFASPALFFRTAGYEVPSHDEAPALGDMDELARLEREEHLYEQTAFVDADDARDMETDRGVKKRKSSRRYPPKALGLKLPAFRVTTGSNSVFMPQANELTHLLKQSFSRQSQSPPSDRSTHMVSFDHYSGLSHWDATEAGREKMLHTATWMASKLES